jgi:large subunit ribosomal protein L10
MAGPTVGQQEEHNRMPTPKKEQLVEQARDWYARSSGMVFTDYRGLKVKEMQELRTNLRANGGEIHVIKNTLLRRAVGEDAEKLPDELHNGPTAVAFLFSNETECAKALVTFGKTHKLMSIKGGYFAGKAMTAAEVEAFGNLPSREVLISQVIGAIAAPISELIGTIEALYADPIRTIGAVADKVAEGSPLPTPEPTAPEPAAAEPAPQSEAESAPAAEEAAPTTE